MAKAGTRVGSTSVGSNFLGVKSDVSPAPGEFSYQDLLKADADYQNKVSEAKAAFANAQSIEANLVQKYGPVIIRGKDGDDAMRGAPADATVISIKDRVAR